MGIHHVPAAQKNNVNPFIKGIMLTMKEILCPSMIKVAPASVVIAVAPILIQ